MSPKEKGRLKIWLINKRQQNEESSIFLPFAYKHAVTILAFYIQRHGHFQAYIIEQIHIN